MKETSEQRSCRKRPRVINIGLSFFYEALVAQKVKTVQLEWRPPIRQSAEIKSLLDDLL
jgi:hypothetical protein